MTFPLGIEIVRAYGAGTVLARCWHPDHLRVELATRPALICRFCKGDDMERSCLRVVKLDKALTAELAVPDTLQEQVALF